MRIDHGKYRIRIEYVKIHSSMYVTYVLVLVYNICKLIILH